MRATIGIDIGGTKILFALFDEKFRIVKEIKAKTPPEKEFDGVLFEAARKLSRKAEKESMTLLGVGVGCSGTVDRAKGTVRESLNIPFLKGYPLVKKLSKATGAAVFLGNDAQLGLYGEHQLGAAVGLSHVIGVFFGTGIGGAAVIDGKLHLGASGAAGEIGHFLISPLGHLTGSERKGTLDDVVSKSAIAGEAAALAARNEAPRLRELAGADVREIGSGALAKAIAKGDKKVEEMLRSRVHMAGVALSNLVDFLNPQMVVLGGGLVEAMPALFASEIEKSLRDHTVAPVRRAVRVAVAKLDGHSVTAGAAKMAQDRILADDKRPRTAGPRARRTVRRLGAAARP
jgi:glucokinase